MSKKNRAEQKKHLEPIQIGPGMFVQNFGHWDLIKTNRTPEEQAAFMETLKDLRRNFPSQMVEKVSELERLLAKHNSFELLANLTVGNLFINFETYKEPTHHHGDALVEYVALLCLKRPFSCGVEPFIGKAYDSVSERLEEIIRMTILYYSLEGIGEADVSTCLDDLRRETITAELMIRNPGYPHHLKEILFALFHPFDSWFLQAVGFTIVDLLSLEKAVFQLINDRFHTSRSNAQNFEKQFRSEFNEFINSGYAGTENRKNYFEKLRELTEDEAERAISTMYAVSFFSHLGSDLSYTSKELSDVSCVPVERVNAALKAFSIRFGSVSSEFLWPKADHPLKQRPFIEYEGQFMCPSPKLFVWAIRPMLERILSPATNICPKSAKDIWARYSDKRADFLEKESLCKLAIALPRAKTYQNLKYQFKQGECTQFGELDGLVVFDKTLILLEAKAGSFPLKARSGYREAILENLKKLVSEAHEQALKAKNFIEGSSKSVFQLENGGDLILEKSQFERVIMMVVTLESLDIFCANLHQTAELGLFPSGELPWVIPLFDLCVITEAIEFPSQLIHYLQRRLRVHRIKKLEANDDLDWFGCYLSGGLVFDQYEHGGPDKIRLGSFTTDFDDYYFYKQGVRKTPAEMPRQKMPELFRKVVLGIDASGLKWHSEAVCLLLDLGGAAREYFSKTLARQLKEAENQFGVKSFTTTIPNATFGVTCFICHPQLIQQASFEFSSFVELMKYDARADKWLGVLCISCHSQPVGSWFYLNSPWYQQDSLDHALAELKVSGHWQKINSSRI